MLLSQRTLRRIEYNKVDSDVCHRCGLKGDGQHRSSLECIEKLRDVIGEIMLYDKSSRTFGLYELYKGSCSEYLLASRVLVGKFLRFLSEVVRSEQIETGSDTFCVVILRKDLLDSIRRELSFARRQEVKHPVQ